MAINRLVISPIARDDLKKIFQYSNLNWGASRATSYLDSLKEQLWSLTDHPEKGIQRDELLPALRSLVVGGHIVFYRKQSQQIEVIRVLHSRQDPQIHLK